MGFVNFVTPTSSELNTSRFASGWVEFATPLNVLGHDIPNGDSTFFDENQED